MVQRRAKVSKLFGVDGLFFESVESVRLNLCHSLLVFWYPVLETVW